MRCIYEFLNAINRPRHSSVSIFCCWPSVAFLLSVGFRGVLPELQRIMVSSFQGQEIILSTVSRPALRPTPPVHSVQVASAAHPSCPQCPGRLYGPPLLSAVSRPALRPTNPDSSVQTGSAVHLSHFSVGAGSCVPGVKRSARLVPM
jgi:hypothetical protein